MLQYKESTSLMYMAKNLEGLKVYNQEKFDGYNKNISQIIQKELT